MKRLLLSAFLLSNLLAGASYSFDLTAPHHGSNILFFDTGKIRPLLQIAERASCGGNSEQSRVYCDSGSICCYSSDRYGPAWCCSKYAGCGTRDYECGRGLDTQIYR